MSRVIHLPVFAQGRPTGRTVEVAAALPVRALPKHLCWMGYRLVQAPRGKRAVERLH